MKKIIILTGSELRHTFFRKYLAMQNNLEVLKSYCEGLEKSIQTTVSTESNNTLRMQHLRAREQSEKDFFELFDISTIDDSSPEFIIKGAINDEINVEKIISLNPDFIISYGCSIIKSKLIEIFKGRFINLHLGLSPYYRGSGTNYFPLVNNEPQFVGVTFMYINNGIDTGDIIHQMQANIQLGDGPHQIGNRLIKDMTQRLCLLLETNDLTSTPYNKNYPSKVYRKKDFTEESVIQLYNNFKAGMIEQYLTQNEKPL